MVLNDDKRHFTRLGKDTDNELLSLIISFSTTAVKIKYLGLLLITS